MDKLEQAVIDVCSDFKLRASRSPHTGVWIGDKKVCALGVRSRDFVTSHGLAINCHTDMRWFEHIVPCGIVGKGVTSLGIEMSPPRHVPTDEVADAIVKHFADNFACRMETMPQEIADGFLARAAEEQSTMVQVNPLQS